MPLSASIFRRGGPKKELFEVVGDGGDDEQELDEKLAELDELLHADKTGRELSAALWRPSLCAAVLVKQRKQTARDMGFIRNRRQHLHIEEAVFLLDRGDLLLFVEEPGATAGGAADGAASGGLADGEEAGGGGGGWRGGRGPRRRQRLLSVQEAMDLMISVGVPLERYLLFSCLSRSGYLVMRHPSRWLLEREEAPEQIWGSGAWAHCYDRTPSVPGTAPHQPMQQQLAAAAAAAAATATAAQAGIASAPAACAAAPTAPHPAGNGPSAMDVDAAGPGPGSAATATAAAAAAGTAVGGGGGSRGWWLAAGPGHPYLSGVPESEFGRDPPAIVEERLVASLQASLPHLRPFPTIRSEMAAAAAAESAPGTLTQIALHAHPVASSSGQGGGSSGLEGGIWLGTPGDVAHLVFDVYKPGSFVSRYKGQFPAVHTHVAMCSEAPPRLAEMQAADAGAAAAAAGEGGRVAGVTWAAVLNGDIALYGIGQADLLCLV